MSRATRALATRFGPDFAARDFKAWTEKIPIP